MTKRSDGSRTQGVRRIIAFNWPKLIAAIALIVAGAVITATSAGALRVGALLGTLAASYFLVASLVVSWWIYDRSDLHAWQWLRTLLPFDVSLDANPWAVLHFGFDESGPSLRPVLGTPDATIDLSARLGRISPSLRRARRHIPTETTALADGAGLPIRSGSLGAVLLVFAAHEVHDTQPREVLFDELHRVLRPTGRVVLVEHLRDTANMLAFGPGAWHFQTRREWTRLATKSGFDTIQEIKKTVFVRGLALCKS